MHGESIVIARPKSLLLFALLHLHYMEKFNLLDV